jgi:hypothetical protein
MPALVVTRFSGNGKSSSAIEGDDNAVLDAEIDSSYSSKSC